MASGWLLQKVYVLGPKYDPAAPNAGEHRVLVDGGLSLYLMMGSEFTRMDAAPAGCIVAIGGLSEYASRSSVHVATPAS